MDEVAEGAAAKIAVAGVNGILELSDLAVYVVLHFVDVLLEVFHKSLVNSKVTDIGNLSINGASDNLVVLKCQYHLSIPYKIGVAGRV